MRFLRRAAKWCAIGLGALILLVIGAVTVLLTTETGGRMLIARLDHPAIPVSVEGYSGRLGSRFELTGIRVAAPPVEATVDRVSLRWRPWQLVRKRLVLDQVHVGGVEVTLTETPPGAEKPAAADSVPAAIELPVEIVIGELVLDRVNVLAPGGMRVDDAMVRVSGGLDDYRVEAAARLAAAPLDSVDLSIRASGAIDHAEIERLEVALLDGRVTASGRASWLPEVNWNITAAIDSLAPGPLLPEPSAWSGAVSLDLTSEGRLVDALPHARVALDSLRGTLRGHPLSGSAHLGIAGRELDLEAIDLSWGAAGLRVEGQVTETVVLDFAVSTSDLGVALPGASGALRLESRATGPRDAPRLDTRIAADRLAFGENRLAALDGEVKADLSGDGTLDAFLVARQLVAGAQAVDSLAVRARGSMRDHEITTHVASDSLGLTLDLRVAGGIAEETDKTDKTDKTWKGEIRELVIDSRAAGMWALSSPASVVAAAQRAALTGFCLTSEAGPAESAEVCAAGSWAKDGEGGGELHIAALPLTLIGPFLPESWTIAGTLAGEAEATIASDTRITASAGFALEEGAITVALGDTTETLGFTARLDARVGEEEGARADLGIEISGAGGAFGEVRGEARLPKLARLSTVADTTAAQPLAAEVKVEFTDLSPLALLAPQVSNLTGRLVVDARAGGALRTPELGAEVRLEDGAVDIVDAGLELSDIGLSLIADAGGDLEVEGSVRSGGGSLTLTAESRLTDPDSLRAVVRIRGERFAVMDTPEIRALISPDLEATVEGRRVDVTGEVRIPVTVIELREIPPSAVGVSGDVEFVDEEAEAGPPPVDVKARVRVAIGDSVSFSGFGFSSRFGGNLLLIEDPGRPTSATGELTVVQGRFKAYGQDLTIGTWGDTLASGREPGRVIFAGGPVDNPGLDMRAFREARDGTIAGLHIQGTAKRPEMTLFSEPAMPEADVLSYIVLGRPFGQGGGDSDVLADAAVGLGLKGGNVLARSLGSKVGLDEAGIESDGELEEASFVAGKYLTPSLYVSHGIGLFDKVNTFRVRYLLSHQWTVQAETGRGTGADVLYRLERGE